jgi:uncharacterized protein (DUF2147 family)
MKVSPGILLAGSLFAGLLWQAAGSGAAGSSFIEGTWRTEDLVLNIFDCNSQVCGRIVWIGDPARRPSQCGKVIVWGLKSTSVSQWAGGSILDPDDGATYDLAAYYQPNGTLRARIFRGIELLGKTKILTRVPQRSLTGWC